MKIVDKKTEFQEHTEILEHREVFFAPKSFILNVLAIYEHKCSVQC